MPMPQTATTVSQYLLDSLYKNGVRHIFGVPGDFVLSFDKRIENHQIKFINATRESTAGYMADAYARLNGLGVACITYGVGINISNPLAQAFVESSPLIVISGAASTKEFFPGIKLHHLLDPSSEGAGDYTQLNLFKLITAGQVVLNDPKEAKRQIDELLTLCLEKQKPVYIEIPKDMVDAPLPHEIATATRTVPTSSDALKEVLQEVTHFLKTCKRPVIWVGHEIQRYRLATPLLQFAERFNIPIVTSLLGKGAISERHRLFAGVYQGKMSEPSVAALMEKCDCVFKLGLLLTDVDTGFFTAKLDYPQQVNARAETLEIAHRKYKISLSTFVHQLATLQSTLHFENQFTRDTKMPFKANPKAKIKSERVFECIQHYLQPDQIIIADIGDSLFGSTNLIVEQDGYLACAHYGSMGFATPGSIGAQIARPTSRVIAIVGDGAFQMTAMELSTAVRYHVDPIIILLNNHGYGTERPLLEGSYNDIQDWDYTKIPEVLKGGQAVRTTTEDEFEDAFKSFLHQRGSFSLIEVELEKTDFSDGLKRFAKLASKKQN